MYNSSLFASSLGLLLLLGLVIAAAYYGAGLIAACLLLVLLLNAGAALWSRSVLRKTEVSIDAGQNACHAGDSLSFTLRVRSRSFFPLIWLDVILLFGKEMILRREIDPPDQLYTLPTLSPTTGLRERFVWLLWQQEIACEETLLAERRGVVSVSQVSLQAGDGLGLAAQHRIAPLAAPMRFAVYPKLLPVDIRPLTRQLSDAEAGPKGQTEDVTLLRSSRPYQHGDPMKRINWRYLAMSGRMEVNQYETITPGCITFLLDLYAFHYLETYTSTKDTQETRAVVHHKELETMLSLIASCLRQLAEQQLRFALIIPGYGDTAPVVCRPGSGETALYPALEALAAIDYRAQETFLPFDEIRRMRRKLGVTQICAYSDAPTLRMQLEALGLSRLCCIACMRSEEHAAGLKCLLAEDLSPAIVPPAVPQEGGDA